MENVRVVTLMVPPDVGLSASFVDHLEVMMVGALGKEWRLREWYEVDFAEEAWALAQQSEFVYVPIPWSDEEGRGDLARQATAAINLALPEISRLLEQNRKSP